MKISKAAPKDYPLLYELEQEWVKEGVSPQFKGSSYSEFLKEIKNASVFKAKLNNKIIGYLLCKIRTAKEDNEMHNIKKGDEYADIDGLYVKRAYRHKGFGAQLVKHCLKELNKHNYKTVILSADSKKQRELIKFYKDQGFQVLFTRMILKLK